MPFIYHITTDIDWAVAQGSGAYTADSLATEGFIHCSDEEQYVDVANRLFRGRQDLVLLQIDTELVPSDIVYENLEGGAVHYPHVYGPIPVAAVVGVTRLVPAAGGGFVK